MPLFTGSCTPPHGAFSLSCWLACCLFCRQPPTSHTHAHQYFARTTISSFLRPPCHVGRSHRKKWRETIRVQPQGVTLKAWLSSVGRGARLPI